MVPKPLQWQNVHRVAGEGLALPTVQHQALKMLPGGTLVIAAMCTESTMLEITRLREMEKIQLLAATITG